jgi:exopolysaccharide biosynthesis polyprenyl glycosylphosphotransferase
MIKERIATLRRIGIFVDCGVICTAYLLGYSQQKYYFPGFHETYPLSAYIGILPVFTFIIVASMYMLGIYTSFRTKSLMDTILIITKSFFLSFIIFSFFVYIFRLDYISRPLILLIFALAYLLMISQKLLLIIFFRHIRTRGHNIRRMLIVGTGRRAQSFVENINKHPAWGLRIVGFVDEDNSKTGQLINGHKVMGGFDDLHNIIRNNVVDEAVFLVPRSWLNKIEDILHLCETEGLRIHVAVDYFELKFSKAKITELHNHPFLTFESTPDSEAAIIIKKIIDSFVSVIALIAALPVFVLIAVLIRLTSRGPVIFSQTRIGLNGRHFTIYKFRTMIPGAETRRKDLLIYNEMQGPVFKVSNDPRVTPVGRFLRKLSLDELPQLWNVFIGSMSLVGPRPLPIEENEYQPWQRRRLSVKPGLTCLWQISGRNRITEFDEWVKLDLEYIDNWSLWLDFVIIAKTVPMVIFGIGAK